MLIQVASELPTTGIDYNACRLLALSSALGQTSLRSNTLVDRMLGTAHSVRVEQDACSVTEEKPQLGHLPQNSPSPITAPAHLGNAIPAPSMIAVYSRF